MPSPKLKPEDFAKLYEGFEAPVSRFDCGKKCSPLNNGSPYCCSTQMAVPVVEKSEFAFLKSRTDLWHRFKPYDAATRQIVEDLHNGACAVECKGAAFCERHNRTLACRAFPFFPYFTRQKEFIGLSVYWVFEDRCWMISNMGLVEKPFVDEFFNTFEAIFAKDKLEFDTYVDFSASMRRVFSRWGRIIPVIGRDGLPMFLDPSTGEPAKRAPKAYPRYDPFDSEAHYRAAVKESGGEVPVEGLKPV